ncbi:hypothetical protein [Brevibacillus sp. DP1.3A]|uniref:hypothetical protein n=1 Tax=Brevibacillus sp. DP1.3A TaxID=2738867 RepID=UPI00156A7DF2|nr:hypothetical protein [Brevibacillus sp. DP1.3A]UED78123.1 hypothetical protein HP399_031010 [Brevibacillus sp. DP1.3A]
MLLGLALIFMVPFPVSYSPELAIRMKLFLSRNFTSAFTFDLAKACCSDPNRDPIYVIKDSNPNVAISLKKSILGNWIVPDFDIE